MFIVNIVYIFVPFPLFFCLFDHLQFHFLFTLNNGNFKHALNRLTSLLILATIKYMNPTDNP